MNLAVGLLSLLTQAVKGFFGIRQDQANLLNTGLSILKDANATDAERNKAAAQIITAEAQSGYWLAACIRPLILLGIVILIVAWMFGYIPPNIAGQMPPVLARLFDMLEIGLYGYIPARTLEKIASQINIAAVLKAFINKTI